MRLEKESFSKTLLRQESALIWIMSLSFIVLAFYCIYKGFTGSLPWLSAMVGFPWTAYGISQAFYYRKSQAENTRNGVKFESALLEMQKAIEQAHTHTEEEIDFDLNTIIFTTEDNPDDYRI